MKNIFKTLAVAVLMMSAVAAFAQSPTSRPAPPTKHTAVQDYEVRSGKVYYGRIEIKDADYRTFENLGHGYAKDKANVWWKGTVLPYVDAKYFRLTTQSGNTGTTPDYGPGAPGAPGYGPSTPGAPGYGPSTPGAPGQGNPPGYGPGTPGYGPGAPGYGPGYGPGAPGYGNVPGGYGHQYVISGNTVYYNGEKVKGARVSSFKDLGWGYAMDTFDVYYCGKEIDASTMNFEVLTDGYAKNVFDVFYCGEEVKGASPSSFKVLSNGYAKDVFDTFYMGKKIDD